MTDFEAAQVKEMRMKGMGYRAIAEALGLSRDIVRNHCKAKGMGGYVAATVKNLKEREVQNGICLCCGKETEQAGTGRPRKFCSEKCRRQWWNAHPQEGNRKAIVTKKCECCGREFSFYRSRKPKYCSYDCYIKARFGRD